MLTATTILKYTDPSGELIVAMLVGSAVGVLANGITNEINGNKFLDNAVPAAFMGMMGGAMAGAGAATLGMEALKGGLSVASSYLPGVNIPLSESMSIGISPSIFAGAGGLGVGTNVGLNVFDWYA